MVAHSRTRFAPRRRCGAALVGVLFFLLIISILLMGVGSFAISHQQRAQVDLTYAQALDLAEAGANKEFNRISSNTSDCGSHDSPHTASLGPGSFSAYCTGTDGVSAWVAPANLIVWATGTVNGTVRTVKVTGKGYSAPGNFAIYTMDTTNVFNGSAIAIAGDIGTNGKFNFSGHPGISGSVYFDGSDAGWYNNNDPGGYTVQTLPQPLQFDTVEQKALALYPNSGATAPGGLAYIATHNSNASAVPPIIGNSITSSVTLVGAAGGSDYYITNMNLTGSNKITLNNTLGPVRIWIGPEGGTGTANFRGGSASIAASTDPTKACSINVATTTGITLAGNETIDASIYAYNKTSTGVPYGYVQNSGNPTINAQILANTCDINGNITVNYVPNLIKPTNFAYYGFNDSWLEVNPR